MNTDQYIPALDNTFACDVYRKGYLQNQHMQEFQLIQNERNTYNEHRHSLAAGNSGKQLMTAMTNPFSSSVNEGDFTQSWQENCQDISQVRPFGDQSYSQFVKTSTEHFNQAVANHFSCDVYGKEFSKNPDLQDLSYSKVPKLSCGKCKKKFAKREELTAHHCLQASQGSFICDICKNEFSEKSVLEKHQLLHTLEQPFACAVCGCRFSTLPDLRVHLQIHSQDKPSPSKVAEKRPISKEGIQISHPVDKDQEKHFVSKKKFGSKQCLDEDRPHACEVCDKRFKSNRNLQKHYQFVHIGQRPYACDLCGKKYKDKQALKYHLLRHAGEKPFHCDKCTQKFTQKSHLRNHQNVHTGEKPFACPICPVKYANRQCFLKHVESHNDPSGSQKVKRSTPKVKRSPKKSNKKSSRLVYINSKTRDLATKTDDGGKKIRFRLKFDSQPSKKIKFITKRVRNQEN